MTATTPVLFVLSCFFCLRTTFSQDLNEPWNSDKYKEEAAQTFNLVFHKYNPRVRPPHERIEVTCNITMRHIRYLDLRKQELQTVLDVEMSWNDSRLQWYPVRVHQISANTSNVWTPDIVFTNSIAETKVLYPSAVKINNKGFVIWTRKEVVTTFCATQPDVDRQFCTISLGFMSNIRNDQTDRYFSNHSNFNVFENFSNHEWILSDTELDLYFDNTTSRAFTLELNLWLDRKSKHMNNNNNNNNNNNDNSGRGSSENTSNNCGSKGELTQRGNSSTSSLILRVPAWSFLWLVSLAVLQCCWQLLSR